MKQRGKQKVILYGNCHMECIRLYLLSSCQFSEKYEIVDLPPIFRLNQENINFDIFHECAVFIYQEVSDQTYKALGTKNIIARLPADCIKICITKSYFTGYHPQYCYNTDCKSEPGYEFGRFPYGDSNILSMHGTKSKDEILKILSDEDFYSKEYVRANVENTLQELRRREQDVDIKIADYIEENFQKKMIFHTVDHPNYEIIHYISSEILERLNLDSNEIRHIIIEGLKRVVIPIYPSVIKALELKFVSADTRYSYFYHEITFSEYIKLYMESCYGM